MKYKNRIEQVDFFLRILKHMDREPKSAQIIADSMGLPISKLKSGLDTLSLLNVIYKKQGKGYFRDSYPTITGDFLSTALLLRKKRPHYEEKVKNRKETIVVPEIRMTKRKCRDCNAFLPESRYFKCFTCQPELPSNDDNFLYHGISSAMLDDSDIDDGDDFFAEDIAVLAKTIPKEEMDE